MHLSRSAQLNFLGLFLFFILAGNKLCYSQEASSAPKEVETTSGFIAIQVGIPSKAMQAAIKNNMGDLGFGGGLVVWTNPFSWGRVKRNSPLRIGGEIGYTYYGRFLSEVNIGGYGGNYKTSYGILQLNAVVQLRPQEPERISPFLEVLAGGNFYLSRTKEDLSVIESSLGIQGFDLDSYASVGFNKGIAIGCAFGGVKTDKEKFTIRLSYNLGNDIKYVVRNSIKYDPYSGSLSYEIGKAPVRYLMVQVGIGI